MPSFTRRTFTSNLAATSALAAAPLLNALQTAPASGPRPNILWLTCEDTGPHLHACGDDYSVTPNLDQFCTRASLYMNAWSNFPVCAPARTTIISGVYPPATGAEHMRSMTHMPAGWKMFPGYLRDVGYYTSNNEKEDYNLEKPEGTWDDSGKKAHWRNRPANKPFFSVFNFLITHESQLRTRPHKFVHDPAKVRVPAYHPDTPEVRQDWAQYYDNITTMDGQAGQMLADLEKDGLANDTIVIFFGDHGSGMPRSKRWPYNSGLNVCIAVHIPEKFRHLAPKDYLPGQKNNRHDSFVDLAPTMLSLAGVKPPDFHQGEAFLGPHATAPRSHVFGFRGRMDERYDCVRTVRDQRFIYIRNYMPHKIYGQHLDYMWETPTTQVWERMYKEGKLNAAQSKFWQTKPVEELYDLANDRDEINNLASAPEHQATLRSLRSALRQNELKIKDIGLLSEAEIHSRGKGSSPYEAGHNPKTFDAAGILDAAELASANDPNAVTKLTKALKHPDSGVRYWAAMGAVIRGAKATEVMREALTTALSDANPSVRIAAGEALAHYGTEPDAAKALEVLMSLADPAKNGAYLSMQALNAIDASGLRATPFKARIRAFPKTDPNAPDRVKTEYVTRLEAALTH